MSNNNFTGHIDFVIPLKKVGLFTRSVLEGIEFFYQPKKIYIVTNEIDISFLEKELPFWKVGLIQMIKEESFFCENFGLTMENLENQFHSKEKLKDEKHREFGWWYQQLIKLGASFQIKDISRKYVVWDADLIPLEKWELVVKNKKNDNIEYHVAILQKQSKNDFNKEEYNKCIFHLLDLECSKPKKEGTFVMHHMIFDTEYVKEMIQFIITKKQISEKWPIYFISLSNQFYRFSEYLLYSTFMMEFYKNEFLYYPYEIFGKSGIRYREPNEIIQKIRDKYSFKSDSCFSYQEIFDYFSESSYSYSYVQFEHVYYIL
jgi:hypothetical protein